MNELERRLEGTLATRAATVVAGGRLSADELVAAGRAARRRRRLSAAAAIAAGAVAVVVAAGVLAQARDLGTTPIPPGSDPPTATAPAAVPIASVGLGYLTDGGIATPAGPPVDVRLPDGLNLIGADRVPGGWVLTVNGVQNREEVSQVWYQPDGGEATQVGALFGGQHAISRDGSRVVGPEGDGRTVAAYELPSRRRIASTRVEVEFGPIVQGVSGDWVVLSEPTGDWRGSTAYAWNVVTGQKLATDAPVNVWGVSGHGQVVRRVMRGESLACVDVVAIPALPRVHDTGACSPDLASDILEARLAPDGDWLVISESGLGMATPMAWVNVADIRAGRWRPTPILAIVRTADAFFWDSDHTFVVSGGYEWYRCGPGQPCQPLLVPEREEGVTVVAGRSLGP